jgi:hypothetical protein
MYPKPLHARFPDRFAVKGEVYPPPLPHTLAVALVHVGFRSGMGGLKIIEQRPKGAHPNEVRVSKQMPDLARWNLRSIKRSCLIEKPNRPP